MNPFKNKKGESILETIIAMGILAIGIMLASTIMGSSLRNINLSKNRVIAVNVAREGIEAMRNIRDTNWLKFSSNRRTCWNHDPAIDNCDNIIFTPIDPGTYIIYKEDTVQKWKLDDLLDVDSSGTGPDFPPPGGIGYTFRNTTENKTYVWDGSVWIDKTTLSFIDMDLDIDTDGDLDKENDMDAYNHILVNDEDAFGKEIRRTNFRRFLTIEYLDNNGTLITNPALLNQNHNRMRITATVFWREAKNEFSTQLSTHITDYLGREILTN